MMPNKQFTDEDISTRCLSILESKQELNIITLRASGITGESCRLATLIRKSRLADLRGFTAADYVIEAGENWDLAEIPDDPNRDEINARARATREEAMAATREQDRHPIRRHLMSRTPTREGRMADRMPELCPTEPFRE
jgi:hypothetical protein